MIYVDTSAFIAVIDRDDGNHEKAKEKWIRILDAGENLVCSNYVLLETCALIQNRLGMEALKAFQKDVAPVIDIIWVNEKIHEIGINAVLAANRRQLSLVDCVSFAVMRHLSADKAFAFDSHFPGQGFELV